MYTVQIRRQHRNQIIQKNRIKYMQHNQDTQKLTTDHSMTQLTNQHNIDCSIALDELDSLIQQFDLINAVEDVESIEKLENQYCWFLGELVNLKKKGVLDERCFRCLVDISRLDFEQFQWTYSSLRRLVDCEFNEYFMN